MIKTKFDILVYFDGSSPICSTMLDAFKNCGIPIDDACPCGSMCKISTHIDRERKFSIESMSRRLALLPYAIINVLDDRNIRPFVTVCIRKPTPSWCVQEIKLFHINFDYKIDYCCS